MIERSLSDVCTALFEGRATLDPTIVGYWVKSYPMGVILYALLESEKKSERCPEMTTPQIVNFANVVMERRHREQCAKEAITR